MINSTGPGSFLGSETSCTAPIINNPTFTEYEITLPTSAEAPSLDTVYPTEVPETFAELDAPPGSYRSQVCLLYTSDAADELT